MFCQSLYQRLLCAAPIFALAISPSQAEGVGMAARCTLDSTYLSQADSLGFKFNGKASSGVLDLERLTQGFAGATFENRSYQDGPLLNLGLPLVNIPGTTGRSISEGGEGEDATWEVSCIRKDKQVLLGEQVSSLKALDGVTWLGQDTSFGWPLRDEGVRQAWIFIPASPVLGLPGQVSGFQTAGQLQISAPMNVRLKRPGLQPTDSRRFHVVFKPRKAVRWSCQDGVCTQMPLKDAEAKSIVRSMARNIFIYWSDVDGWLADAAAAGKDEERTWTLQWYVPGKLQTERSGRP